MLIARTFEWFHSRLTNAALPIEFQLHSIPEMATRTLKVFLASPSDVTAEREALSRLVRDINEVLAFLAPERQLVLELVRNETHAYRTLAVRKRSSIDRDQLTTIFS